MTEQQATDKLEQMVGVDRSFRLMDIYRNCRSTASGNKFTLTKMPTVEELFRKFAKQEGYSDQVINHYLNYIR